MISHTPILAPLKSKATIPPFVLDTDPCDAALRGVPPQQSRGKR